MNWKTIESAPKGRNVIATNNINAVDAHGDKSHVWIGTIQHSTDKGYFIFNEGMYLTHWQPLPEPPTEK